MVRARLITLKRLVTLYSVVEEMHSSELKRLTGAVREAQQSIGVQKGVMCLARLDGLNAMAAGDPLGRSMAEASAQSAEQKKRRLEAIHLELQVLSDAERGLYMASRLKSEQMKSVVGRVEERITIEEHRRVQASSDDRFLARLRWKDAHSALNVDEQMKGY